MDEMGNVVGAVFLLLLVALGLALPIISTIWAYGDAERRGKSGCLVAILVLFLSWPLGLILWIVFRPEPRDYGPY